MAMKQNDPADGLNCDDSTGCFRTEALTGEMITETIASHLGIGRRREVEISKLLVTLLECWAVEKDYELRNQLLSKLVLKYASSMNKLLELNQLKNKFLGMATHDLRNPLISIRGLSEILLGETMGTLSAEQKEFIAIINTVSSDMLNLVNDLLDLSVIESGRLDLKLEWTSLEELLKERVRIHGHRAGEKNITLHTDIEQIPDCRIDSSKIAQVVDNLITNAIKFSPFNTSIYITLRDESPEWVVLSVTDEGPGIPEKDLLRIFGEFQKSSSLPTAGEKSTGLGLAIAKKIVEVHRGTLKVNSRVGSGSTFTCKLPKGTKYGGSKTTQGDDCG